ncbi:MAG: CAP domain-containing protein [Thermodesulfobacteriota bacterium]
MKTGLALGLLMLLLLPVPVRAGDQRLADVEKRVAELVNRERSAQGLGRLEYDLTLADIAAAHSQDMLDRGYFSHRNPEGWLERHRISFRYRSLIGVGGENIWGLNGQDRSADELAGFMLEGWMKSDEHRGNILRPSFTRQGVGVMKRDGTMRATHLFLEAVAWLFDPVPYKVRRNQTLRLTAQGAGPAGAPDQARLDILDSDAPATDFQPVEAVKVDVRPGFYRLKFRFSRTKGDTTRFTIVPGPIIEVY